MLLHFGVIAYIIFGGFLAWRFRWALVPHLLAVTWGALIIMEAVDCPLTALEDWARRNASEQGLSRGFIDTYLTGVVYPGDMLTIVRIGAATVVLVSWLGLLIRRHMAKTRKLVSPVSGGRAGGPSGRG